MDAKNDGNALIPDLRRLRDRELRDLIERAAEEWAGRVRAARAGKRTWDPALVADAMIAHWLRREWA